MKRFMPIMMIGMILYPGWLLAEEKLFTLLHTNDLHSHLLGFSPNIDYTPLRTGDDSTIGGWARIAAVIKSEKSARTNPTLVLDAGDFLMGSLFHMVAREEGLELRLMNKMGYDVVTLGNHEFDLTPCGLARILTAGYQKGGIPEIVFSNLIFNPESSEDDTLEEVFRKGIVKSYTVKEIQGVRIGIYGILGKDAAEVSPFAKPIKFTDPVEISHEMVKLLREKEKVDLVICLSHSGLREYKRPSEDERLAEGVPGIDIIVSGHTHKELMNPLMVNQTIIVHTGAFGKYVGALDLAYENGKVKLKGYRLIEINDTIQGDKEIQERIESYMDLINENILKGVNLTFYQVLAKTDFDLRLLEDESNLW